MELEDVKKLLDKIGKHKKRARLRIDFDGSGDFECTFESLKLDHHEYDFPLDRHEDKEHLKDGKKD